MLQWVEEQQSGLQHIYGHVVPFHTISFVPAALALVLMLMLDGAVA